MVGFAAVGLEAGDQRANELAVPDGGRGRFRKTPAGLAPDPLVAESGHREMPNLSGSSVTSSWSAMPRHLDAASLAIRVDPIVKVGDRQGPRAVHGQSRKDAIVQLSVQVLRNVGGTGVIQDDGEGDLAWPVTVAFETR